jgi:hypothetical protein
MTETWYEVVAPDQPLTQGDLLSGCPVLGWKMEPTASTRPPCPPLHDRAALFRQDVVVLTQACDLEHHKVHNVVLCPHFPLPTFRLNWEKWMTERRQAISEKAWRRFCEDIAAGYVWNLTLLEHFDHPELATNIRVVNFHELHTVP